MNDFANSLVSEIACLQTQLEQAQKNVTALKRRIRGLSKHLAEYQLEEPITDKENVPHD